jgi:AcrR family transcriptional regulator
MRTQLLDAFASLLHEVGYADVTLADVAARAGMARNTIYNYFDDKEALLMALIDRSVEQFVADVRAAVDALPDAPSQLEAFIRLQMAQFRREPAAGSDAGMVDSSMLGAGGQGELLDHFRPLHDLVRDLIRDGVAHGTLRAVDPERSVMMVFAVLRAERIPVGTGVREPAEAADEVIDFVLHALRA